MNFKVQHVSFSLIKWPIVRRLLPSGGWLQYSSQTHVKKLCWGYSVQTDSLFQSGRGELDPNSSASAHTQNTLYTPPLSYTEDTINVETQKTQSNSDLLHPVQNLEPHVR